MREFGPDLVNEQAGRAILFLSTHSTALRAGSARDRREEVVAASGVWAILKYVRPFGLAQGKLC